MRTAGINCLDVVLLCWLPSGRSPLNPQKRNMRFVCLGCVGGHFYLGMFESKDQGKAAVVHFILGCSLGLRCLTPIKI